MSNPPFIIREAERASLGRTPEKRNHARKSHVQACPTLRFAGFDNLRKLAIRFRVKGDLYELLGEIARSVMRYSYPRSEPVRLRNPSIFRLEILPALLKPLFELSPHLHEVPL